MLRDIGWSGIRQGYESKRLPIINCVPPIPAEGIIPNDKDKGASTEKMSVVMGTLGISLFGNTRIWGSRGDRDGSASARANTCSRFE